MVGDKGAEAYTLTFSGILQSTFGLQYV